MTSQDERKVIAAINVTMALVIVGFVSYFLYEAHKMFTNDDNVGGWMALGVAAVFVAIGILGVLANGDD